MNLVSVRDLVRPSPRPKSQRSAEERFAYAPYPASWVQVAWTHELARGQPAGARR